MRFLRKVALVCGLGLVASANAANSYQYEVLNLGFSITDINNNGQVVGVSNGSAFYWDSSSGVQNIGFLGRDKLYASALNDSGQVSGFAWTGNEGEAFIWDKINGMQSLGNISAFNETSAFTKAWDINNYGQVVGTYSLESGSYPVRSNSFLWNESSGMRDLTHGSEDLEIRSVTKINDLGQVLGTAIGQVLGTANRGGFGVQPIVWDDTRGKTYIGESLYKAYNINNNGQVAGAKHEYSYSNLYGSGSVDHAAILDLGTGVIQDIGRLGGRKSRAMDLNDIGQVIGVSETDEHTYRNNFKSTVFIWDSTNGIQDLNELIDPESGVTLRSVRSINNLGQIVADGYLLNPVQVSAVPEPSTYALILSGLGLVGFMANRRKKTSSLINKAA
jgi:hypothetical protein